MNTTALILAGVGLFLWLFPVLNRRLKKSAGQLSGYFLQRNVPAPDKPEVPAAVTIEHLEAELGITPDVYLCDRISRINEALINRRDGTKTKKGGVK